jgi:hypothetical protein
MISSSPSHFALVVILAVNVGVVAIAMARIPSVAYESSCIPSLTARTLSP